MAGAGHEVICRLVDSLLELCELADVGEAVLRLRRVELIAQVMEHFDAIVEVDGLVKKLAQCSFRKMFEHGGRYSLTLGLGAWEGGGPVGDVGEERVTFVRSKAQEKEGDRFWLSVPFWKVC